MPPKRKSDSADNKEAVPPPAKKSATQPASATPGPVYGEEVLGRKCLVLFEVQDSETRVPYSGIVTAYEATLKLEQILSLEQKAPAAPAPTRKLRTDKASSKKKQESKSKVEPRKPRRMEYRTPHGKNWKKCTVRLHLVTFEDGDTLWLDLAELKAEGTLWWEETETKDKQEESKDVSSPAPAPQIQAMMPSMMMPGMMSPAQLAAWQQQQQQQWTNQMMANLATPANTPATGAASVIDQTQAAVQAALASYHAQAAAPQQKKASGKESKPGERRGRPKGSKNKPKNPTPAAPTGTETAATPKQALGTEATTSTEPIAGTKTTAAATPAAAGQATTAMSEAAPAETAKPTPKKSTPKRAVSEKPLTPTGIEWVDEFVKFLTTVPHGRMGRVASDHNAKRIMTSILKLAKGQGVGTKTWPVVFYQDVTVNMDTDISLLLQHSIEFQAKYGDPSGGWLLKHPIEKMVIFKEYKKDPEAFAKATQEAIAKKATPKKSPAKKTGAAGDLKEAPPKSTEAAKAAPSPKRVTTTTATAESPRALSNVPVFIDPEIDRILTQAARDDGISHSPRQGAVAPAQRHPTQANPSIGPAPQYRPNASHATLAQQPINAFVGNQAPAGPQGNEWPNQFLSPGQWNPSQGGQRYSDGRRY